MEITGKVVAIDLNATVKGQKGTYKGAELIYKDLSDGTNKTKAFHENAFKFNAALKNGLENLAVGDEFTAVLEKKDEFWNWVSVSKGVNGVPANKATSTNAPAKSAPSTYATADERAQTQVYIVRQSSITNALKLLELQGNKKVVVGDVLEVAEQLEAWVFGKKAEPAPAPKKAAAKVLNDTTFEDDIPF